jgi:hypothetical protein|tara:strand:+ start:6 stop:2033 length:2028 start_codon:yes stop_codon:yes gene_type:complete
MQKIQNSSFWFDDSNDVDVLTGEKIQLGKDYIKLAATKRAIANFVQIVTNKNIPVKFNTKGDSYTDGKSVTISANLKSKDFDPAVGLALHEGSHILLTDFDTLRQLQSNWINQNMKETIEMVAKKYGFYEKEINDEGNYITTDKIDLFTAQNYILSHLKNLLNIVEDRRIDNYIFKSAPGYKAYYHAMYDKYFNAKVIDKALQSNEKTSTDWDSYFFRICNITNSNRNLDALPVLRKIWNTLDLRNISRLKDSWMALDVAVDIFNIVEESLPKPPSQDSKSTNKEQSKDNDDKNGGNGSNQLVPDQNNISKGNGSKGREIELTDAQKNQLQRAIEKQKEFSAGQPQKSNISKKDEKIVEAISTSGSETKEVGNETLTDHWSRKNGKTDCIVVKNLTAELANSGVYNTFNSNYWRSKDNIEPVQKGLSLGKMLGRKLQIRNESNTLKYTRLHKGKIDKRLISSLGFGAENVFETSLLEQFNNSIVHLSIDASGSMNGGKFEQSLIAASAIAKAASMTNNFDVVISFRSTEDMGRRCLPAIFIAYDSRKHKIQRLSTILPSMNACGITPEGLCFEAIMNEIDASAKGKDSYFINFSDGEPYFENPTISYWGQSALKHTKQQVDKMIAKGVKVLSYFIGGGYSNDENFKSMYGKDAQFIDTNQLVPLAKSLNKMFTEK